MKTIYITISQAIETHTKTVDVSGGGVLGQLDMGRLESVLDHMRNDLYYPSFEEKLTHLFFCACNFHCFADGNKRIAISLGALFLLLNGYIFIVKHFINAMENISYHVASGAIDKDFLKEIIIAVLNDSEDEEELKFKIMKAIS